MAARVFIDGEAGTTGLQIRERLAGRADIELLQIPEDRRKDPAVRAEFLNAADVAILCLPDEAAKQSVGLISNRATRVIDASTAHRVAEGWTYGFAEMDKDQSAAIAAARFVANPGCWPQGVIATVRPLIAEGLLPADFAVTVNGITGYSGGGKAMIADYETMGGGAPDFIPYALSFNHKHLPEMRRFSGLSRDPLFVPAVGDFYKGMVVAVPLQLAGLERVPTGADLHAAIADHYAGIAGGFVDVAALGEIDKLAEIEPEHLNGTNLMRLYVFANDAKAQAVLLAVYDNLGKGASGAAVQNLNLIIGAAPGSGL